MKAFWNARPERDRRIIVAGAWLAGLALLVALVVLPADRARARLAPELPRMRASIAALQRDAAEVKRLRALPALAPSKLEPLANLATQAGGLAGAQIAVIDAQRVRLSGGDIAFGALLEWLRSAQATYGMRVESARLDALPAPGRVRAELVLTRA